MSQGTIVVVNPYSGAEVGQVPAGTAEEVDAAVQQAHEGAEAMRKMPLHRRAEILATTGQILLRETESLARLITAEAGKTIRETRAEVARAAGIFQLAAEETRRLHGETVPFDALSNGEGHTGYWTRVPLGVVGAITPWNVPLALAAHKLAPALGGGNAVVFKPAEQTPLIGLRLVEVLRAAGLPAKALVCVTGDGAVVGDALVTHPDVAFLSFTGSREVGLKLPGRAGYKRVTLELGGNSPVIITPSADLFDAADAIVRGGFAVAGQLCISVQRVLVHENVQAALTAELLPRIRALRLGDPGDETTDVGTLISPEACTRVAEAVQTAKREGATVLIGGERVGASAYSPTLLTNIDPTSALAREEAFAPLLLLMPYRTFDEAILLANSTPYGLNAGIYTNDLEEALRAADEIDAGSVLINEAPTFRSDLMPYGGRKQSGLGREGVRFALQEMTDPKLICFRRVPRRP